MFFFLFFTFFITKTLQCLVFQAHTHCLFYGTKCRQIQLIHSQRKYGKRNSITILLSVSYVSVRIAASGCSSFNFKLFYNFRSSTWLIFFSKVLFFHWMMVIVYTNLSSCSAYVFRKEIIRDCRPWDFSVLRGWFLEGCLIWRATSYSNEENQCERNGEMRGCMCITAVGNIWRGAQNIFRMFVTQAFAKYCEMLDIQNWKGNTHEQLLLCRYDDFMFDSWFFTILATCQIFETQVWILVSFWSTKIKRRDGNLQRSSI